VLYLLDGLVWLEYRSKSWFGVSHFKTPGFDSGLGQSFSSLRFVEVALIVESGEMCVWSLFGFVLGEKVGLQVAFFRCFGGFVVLLL